MSRTAQYQEDIVQLRVMRFTSVLEGCTLLALLCIAVPLKHFAGVPLAVRVMGPVHGLSFVLYLWTLIRTVSSGDWSRAEVVRMAAAAVIPFGAFMNERQLARRQSALENLSRGNG